MRSCKSRASGERVILEALEPRLLLAAWLPGNMGTFMDSDGDQYTVKLTGPGQVAVTLVDPDLDGNGPIDQIEVAGTDPLTSRLSILARSGTRGQPPKIEANSIIGSALKSISAKDVDLVGTGIDLTGYLGSVILQDVENGADILADGDSTQTSTITVVDVDSDSQIDLGSQISKFTAADLDTCTITAPAIGALMVLGKRSVGMDGNCYADLVISGENAPQGVALKSAKVAAWLEDCTWTVTAGSVGAITAAVFDNWTAQMANSDVKSLTTKGSVALDICGDFDEGHVTANSLAKLSVHCYLMESTFTLSQAPDATLMALGNVNVKGWMENTSILSTGNIGNVTVEGMADSTIFAGVTATHDDNVDDVLDLPDPATEIALDAGRATIKSVKVLGDREEEFSIINSNIAAAELGTVWVRYVQTVNGGVSHGLAADLIKTLVVKYEGGGITVKNLDLASDSYYEDAWCIVLV